MKNIQTRITNKLKCPNCSRQMQGVSIGLHHFECSDCGTTINGITISSNEIQGIFTAICIVGVIAIIAAALK